jgi:hypothetical protein
MTRTGTANYRSMADIYRAYGKVTGRIKLEEGLILLGQPETKPGDIICVDKAGRYFIERGEP